MFSPAACGSHSGTVGGPGTSNMGEMIGNDANEYLWTDRSQLEVDCHFNLADNI